ncbi:hypothetical protein HPULCUR_006085 [Helicostylum pulchrum]|uniref:Uncharacterized protein n=1 Tax=Helicostylum pulchrum TaxID=562976 RepID=A0ABP9Y0Y1_9FUNG
MVCSKFEVYDSRIEELEKSIQETEMYLETFVKTYQETRDRVVKSSNRADMLETDLYMARVEKKDSDTYSRVLSKDHSKLEAEVSGLSKEIKNLKAFKLGVEDGNAFEISKIANRNFVAINKLKEENSKLRE